MKARDRSPHPVDLMGEFWGRLSVFEGMGIAVLERTGGGSQSEVCSEGLARGLVLLARDYEEMQDAVHEWIEKQVDAR